MTLNNLLNDSIVRIRNGLKARKHEVLLKKSKLSLKVLEILRNEGYIRGFQTKNQSILVLLKYFQDKPAIKEIKAYSPLSVKSTVSLKELKQLCNNKERRTNGLALNILSTPSGIFSDFECIRNHSGGKLLLMIM